MIKFGPQPALLPIGRVYFITDGDAIKIGYSDAPEARMRTLQSASSKLLRIINTAPGTPDDEKRVHKQFDHLRLKGEWFRPAPELIEFIPEFCKFGPVVTARSELAAWSVGKPKAVQNAVRNLDGWLSALGPGHDPDFKSEGVSVLGCTARAVETLRIAHARSAQGR